MSKTELLLLKDVQSRKGMEQVWQHLWSKESDPHAMERQRGGAVTVAKKKRKPMKPKEFLNLIQILCHHQWNCFLKDSSKLNRD